ncbi:MAG TPA: serine hydrolase, partial [Nocardioides sp.]|nr:serine hydrolase [Nocardioides sp.]
MTRRMRIDDLTDLAVPSQPALSPDGDRVAYVLRTLDREADRPVDELWTVPTAGGTPRRLTAGPSDTAPAWSPDGSHLAFLRDGQVHVLAVGGPDGGALERLTDLPLGAGAPAWSPDGSRLAFSAPVDPAGQHAQAPLVAARLDYQADGAGMFGAVRNQLHVVEVATRACRAVTHGTEHAGQPAWSPDGRTLAFTRKVGADSDLTFRTAVHVLDVDERKALPRVVALAGGVAGTVSFARDGGSLLVVGYPGDPVGHQHLLRVPLDGGEPVSLTGHLDRNVMAGGPAYPGGRPQEDGDGRLLFCLRDRG